MLHVTDLCLLQGFRQISPETRRYCLHTQGILPPLTGPYSHNQQVEIYSCAQQKCHGLQMCHFRCSETIVFLVHKERDTDSNHWHFIRMPWARM